MGKAVVFFLILILFSSIVLAQNYRFLYNPYTAKLDRTLRLNQTGFNLTADNFIGNLIGSINDATLWGLSNFTGAYDNRADRYGRANYSSEYASTGYKIVNFTDEYARSGFKLGNYSDEYSSTGFKLGNWSVLYLAESLTRFLNINWTTLYINEAGTRWNRENATNQFGPNASILRPENISNILEDTYKDGNYSDEYASTGFDNENASLLLDNSSIVRLNVTLVQIGYINVTEGYIDGEEIATLNDLTAGNVTITTEIEVRNDESVTLNKGDPVYFTSYISGLSLQGVKFANNTLESTHADCIIAETIGAGARGQCVETGHVIQMDTSEFGFGDDLYLDTGGNLTTEKQINAVCIQKIGMVLRSHASQGVVWVNGVDRCNDVPKDIDITGNVIASNLIAAGNVNVSQNLIVLGNIYGEIPDSFKVGNWTTLYDNEAGTRFDNENDSVRWGVSQAAQGWDLENSSSQGYIKNNTDANFTGLNVQGLVNATNLNGTLDCTMIGGGSDTDFCVDGGGGTSVWNSSGSNVFLNDSTGSLDMSVNGQQILGSLSTTSDGIPYSYKGDTDTGMRRIADNQIAFATNNLNRLIIRDTIVLVVFGGSRSAVGLALAADTNGH
ncbi:hypothetical protein LCGC14_1657590 [marine sediment metagenome]|uniref:Uncharacterized protein n=1 Tax=marine sediment metagenome TaxID=412755 RepID=A0A0F9KV76_9ZZZZ